MAELGCDAAVLLIARRREQRLSSEDADTLADHIAGCSACAVLDGGTDEVNRALESAPPSSRETDEHIGLDIGPYRIERELGAGGMGWVYLATHTEIGSRVAIKIFSRDWQARPELVERFFTEARATNKIQHENIVSILDVGHLESGRPYLVMEHLQGRPLSALIGDAALTGDRILNIALDVLSALEAAHENEIIHRDLKPDNIFVSPSGRATLLDFGVAKLLGDVEQAVTTTGAVIGTPRYMAPEQATASVVDHRTDIYALGVILYECFTGRRPFDADAAYELLHQHVTTQPAPPSSLRDDLDPNIEAAILIALSKRPEDRFGSAGEMRDILAACAGKTTLTPSQTERLEKRRTEVKSSQAATVDIRPSSRPAPEESKSRSWGWVLAAATITSVVAVGIVVAKGLSKEKPTNPVVIVASDAANLDAASVTDAAPVAVLDATFETEPPRPPKPLGQTPRSLYRRAVKAATARAPDAVLRKISIAGFNIDGTVDPNSAGADVRFYFFSPQAALDHLASKKGGKGKCVVRVAMSASGTRTSKLRGDCSRPDSVPALVSECSLRAAIRRHPARDQLGQSKATPIAVYARSSARRPPSWSTTIAAQTAQFSCP